MKPWGLAVAPLALIASQAVAENWVIVDDTTGTKIEVDKDSIRRGNDGLVYFTDYDEFDGDAAIAMDCERHVFYALDAYQDWRKHENAVTPNSIAESEMKYVCANAR